MSAKMLLHAVSTVRVISMVEYHPFQILEVGGRRSQLAGRCDHNIPWRKKGLRAEAGFGASDQHVVSQRSAMFISLAMAMVALEILWEGGPPDNEVASARLIWKKS
jgi:hypothetical protein